MAEFTMPSLGADMEEGTLQEWLVQSGGQVHKGDPVAVVETAKSTIEVECFETGTMGKLLVQPGTTVPVGTALAMIEPAAAEPATSKRKRPVRKAQKPTTPPSRLKPSQAPVPSAQPHEHIEAGPLTRHLAERSSIDLDALHGSGPGGRITRYDVERAASASKTVAHPTRVRATPLARRLAAELNIDLAAVTGTGKDGAIRATDVRKAAPGTTTEAPRPRHIGALVLLRGSSWRGVAQGVGLPR